MRVPPEVDKARESAAQVVRELEEHWPTARVVYPNIIAQKIIAGLSVSMAKLAAALRKAAEDTMVSELPEQRKQVIDAIEMLRKTNLSLKEPLALATRDKVIRMPDLRAYSLRVMKQTLVIWKTFDGLHDTYMAWMDGTTAEDIGDGFKQVAQAVYSMPDVKEPGTSMTAKAVLGAVGLAAFGGAAWLLSREGGDGPAPEEGGPMPAGIHVISPHRVDADVGGEHVSIVGDSADKPAMLKIAHELVAMRDAED
jgi:hypothetical protein